MTYTKLTLTTILLFGASLVVSAQELRPSTNAATLEVASPDTRQGMPDGQVEQARALKELHGRVSQMLNVLDRKIAGSDKEGAARWSGRKEEMSASLREIEAALSQVSSTTDADRAAVNKSAASLVERTDARVNELRKELSAEGGR